MYTLGVGVLSSLSKRCDRPTGHMRRYPNDTDLINHRVCRNTVSIDDMSNPDSERQMRADAFSMRKVFDD